ncbi:hypothetical protein R50073_10260 [Maricurvus nonylphenolicus]
MGKLIRIMLIIPKVMESDFDNPLIRLSVVNNNKMTVDDMRSKSLAARSIYERVEP